MHYRPVSLYTMEQVPPQSPSYNPPKAAGLLFRTATKILPPHVTPLAPSLCPCEHSQRRQQSRSLQSILVARLQGLATLHPARILTGSVIFNLFLSPLPNAPSACAAGELFLTAQRSKMSLSGSLSFSSVTDIAAAPQRAATVNA